LCFCIQWDLGVRWFIPELSRREMSIHYFSCSGGPGAFSIKKRIGTHYAKVVFWIWSNLRVM
jgi:hypothetical protein